MKNQVSNMLWRIYNRPDVPKPWSFGGNLPWDDPDFSARMLKEHLDESHGAASRQTAARERMMTWLWQKLGLQAGSTLFDVACGPGLYAVPFAQRGVQVTGVDFGPAAIAYARELAQKEGVDERTTFHEQDMRTMDFAGAGFDAAMLIYGQLAVMTREEAQTVLTSISDALKLGGKLCIELLDKK
ncbi:MAG: methyltransferase domain-containing protein, partial [Chloroflexi bacterium]|nr:methyltransferase domain-containing protein [Chloroflexota bacterium]